MTGRHETEAGNLSVVMLLEQHLGHETFAVNLLRAAEQYDDLDVTAVPIRYDTSNAWIPAWPGLVGLRGTLAGRDEDRAALITGEADAWVYNTQVPAALAGRRLRRPYIVVTDVTPIQYDRIA